MQDSAIYISIDVQLPVFFCGTFSLLLVLGEMFLPFFDNSLSLACTLTKNDSKMHQLTVLVFEKCI